MDTTDFIFSFRFLRLTYLNSKEENDYAEGLSIRVATF